MSAERRSTITCSACIAMLNMALCYPVLVQFGPLTRHIVAQGRHFHWLT